MPKPPTGWGEDELTRYFDFLHNNHFATFERKPREFVLHHRIDNWLNRFASDLINPGHEISASLILRAHLLFRTSSALSSAGDLYSSMTVQRTCAETSAYALVTAKSDAALKLWIERADSKASKSKARDFFKHSKVLKIISCEDSSLADTYDKIYQRSIDFGAHPNSSGVFSNTELEAIDGNTHIKQTALHGPGVQFTAGLKSTAQTGVLLIRICDALWPERTQLLRLKAELKALRLSC